MSAVASRLPMPAMTVRMVSASNLGSMLVKRLVALVLAAPEEKRFHMVIMSTAGLPVRLMTVAPLLDAGGLPVVFVAGGAGEVVHGDAGQEDSAMMGLDTVLSTMAVCACDLDSTDSLTAPVAAQPRYSLCVTLMGAAPLALPLRRFGLRCG